MTSKEPCINKDYIRELNGVPSTKCLFIYTGLIVYTILNLAYSKIYVYYIPLTYSMTSLFWNLLCPFVICDTVSHVMSCKLLILSLK